MEKYLHKIQFSLSFMLCLQTLIAIPLLYHVIRYILYRTQQKKKVEKKIIAIVSSLDFAVLWFLVCDMHKRAAIKNKICCYVKQFTFKCWNGMHWNEMGRGNEKIAVMKFRWETF